MTMEDYYSQNNMNTETNNTEQNIPSVQNNQTDNNSYNQINQNHPGEECKPNLRIDENNQNNFQRNKDFDNQNSNNFNKIDISSNPIISTFENNNNNFMSENLNNNIRLNENLDEGFMINNNYSTNFNPSQDSYNFEKENQNKGEMPTNDCMKHPMKNLENPNSYKKSDSLIKQNKPVNSFKPPQMGTDNKINFNNNTNFDNQNNNAGEIKENLDNTNKLNMSYQTNLTETEGENMNNSNIVYKENENKGQM